MTEAKLKALQELHACKKQLESIESHLDKSGFDIIIQVNNFDICMAEVPVRLYPEFCEDFKQFIRTQYAKYKEAFDNA